MRMTAMLIIVFIILTILACALAGCEYNSRPIARIQEQGTAVITSINRGGTYVAGIHRHECRIRVENSKYGVSATFCSSSVGLWNKPRYWNCQQGESIDVIVNIEYYTDDNAIRRIWITEP